jgi:Peptidase M66
MALAACGGGGGDNANTAADDAAAEQSAAQSPQAAFTWSRIAGEGENFNVAGTQVVRYGSGSTWLERSVTGGGDCTNAFFQRDPLFGVFKECQVQGGVAAPPPPPPPPPGGNSSARIVNIEIAQSLLFPSSDSELVLLRGKATLVKVNAIAGTTTQAAPEGTLRVENQSGQLLQSIALTRPSGALPSAPPLVPSFTDAYSAVVPGNLVQPGLRLVASLANGQAPSTVDPRVGSSIDVTLVTIPITIAGTTGTVAPDTGPYVQARMPASSVTVRQRAAYVSRNVPQLPGDDSAWGDAFSTVLRELGDLHTLEQASDDTYYAGFMPKRSYGLAGIGYVPGNATLTFSVSSTVAQREVLTHELGHNFSLPHAPCGGPRGPDPEYPYPNAQLGEPGRYIWGYNEATRTFTDPRRTDIHDVMSYCDGDTFSDYNFRKMQVFKRPSDRASALADRATAQAASTPQPGPQDLLLVSGQINNGGNTVEINPVKTLMGQARGGATGDYVLRIVTAQGTVLHRFAPKTIDHISDVQHFSIAIPNPGAIRSMSIVRNGTVLMDKQAEAASTERAQRLSKADRPRVQVTEQGGLLRLTWDQSAYPYLTVTHVVGPQRSTLALDLEGGSASLPLAGLQGGSFEFSLSDGINTARVTHDR